MLQKDNRDRILSTFFASPTREFHLREISRQAGVAPPSCRGYLRAFEREGLVKRAKKGLYPTYSASREDPCFKNAKKWSLALELTTGGLVDYIVALCSPDAIILFGSASRGEDTESSDIDLAIIAEEIPLDLRPFERRFHRKIEPLFRKSFGEWGSELKNNILNGIVLYGYVTAFSDGKRRHSRDARP